MAARDYTKEELRQALFRCGVSDFVDVTRYGSGHINDTFKVETASGKRYILQRINTDIFGDGELLKHNIIRVTSFLSCRGIPSLKVVGYENPWRVFEFLEGYKTVDVVTNPAEAELAASAFAKFQNDLADIPEPRLKEIIAKFHDTPDRIRQLDEAAKADVKGRRKDVEDLLAFVDKYRGDASRIVDMMADGKIPERVTHNDTKINNVMLSSDGTSVVIDLDTTMPGSALYDFGDMVRTSSAAAMEDETDLDKVYSKKEYFEAIVKGYLSGAKFLLDSERDNLVFSAKLMTLEVGIRFLTDYLAGDIYFHTAYPEHNLVRARNQFKMVQSIESQNDEYEAIVKKYSL
jgi:N-acetylhexosamine 1-kinase